MKCASSKLAPSICRSRRRNCPTNRAIWQSSSPALGNKDSGAIPPALRRRLRVAHKRYMLRRSINQFYRDPRKAASSTADLLGDLIYGWGNEGWSAFPEFLSACVGHALASKGAILECGSGLTTVLLGLLAKRQGSTVWALEDSPEWSETVNGVLRRHQIDCVRLCTVPLRNFGEFHWYDPPLEEMPEFSLVICDGPAAQTPGGRYGLLPAMRDKLCKETVVLLDDAIREDDRSIGRRWAAEFHMNCELLGSDRPFLRLTFPATKFPG